MASTSPGCMLSKATTVSWGVVTCFSTSSIPSLTAALRTSDSYLVHGLDASVENVEQARKHVQSLGLYGSVTVDRFDGKRLPYVNNLVNLVVAEDGFPSSLGFQQELHDLAHGPPPPRHQGHMMGLALDLRLGVGCRKHVPSGSR